MRKSLSKQELITTEDGANQDEIGSAIAARGQGSQKLNGANQRLRPLTFVAQSCFVSLERRYNPWSAPPSEFSGDDISQLTIHAETMGAMAAAGIEVEKIREQVVRLTSILPSTFLPFAWYIQQLYQKLPQELASDAGYFLSLTTPDQDDSAFGNMMSAPFNFAGWNRFVSARDLGNSVLAAGYPVIPLMINAALEIDRAKGEVYLDKRMSDLAHSMRFALKHSFISSEPSYTP